jgi:AraC family transcriptional regulator, transcriptional activator FtrA
MQFKQFGRILLRGVVLALILVLLPIATGLGVFSYKAHQIVADTQPALGAPLPPLPTPDPSKRIAVVLLSNSGTEITDALPPYELLAASNAFNTYVVAPERRVLPMTGALQLPAGIERLPVGLDVLPHYGFADYERIVGRDPDLVIIPNLTAFTPESERPILDWLRAHAGPQTTLLSICSGSRVLLATGLLDGHSATSSHQTLPDVQRLYPTVRWQAGVRWVDDGQFITSGTLTAGIDATLHVIERLAGRDVVESAARSVGYQHLDRLDNPAADYRPPVNPDLGFMPNAMYGWSENNFGVVLYDGISETALAALLDISALNLMHIDTLAPERMFIRSRYGVILAPRFSYADAPTMDRVIVLSALADAHAVSARELWNQLPGQPRADILLSGAGADFAYDAVIADVARHAGGAVARSDARNFVYPVDRAIVGSTTWRPRLILLPLSVVLLSLALVALVARRRAQRLVGSRNSAERLRSLNIVE